MHTPEVRRDLRRALRNVTERLLPRGRLSAPPRGVTSVPNRDSGAAIRARMWWAVGPCFAILALIDAIAFVQLDLSRSAERWVSHTQEVIAGLETVLAETQVAQSAERGYLLAADPRDLERLRVAGPRAQSAIEHVRFLTGDNPAQQARAAELQTAVGSLIDDLHEAAIARATRGPLDGFAAAAALEAERAKAQTVRSAIARMELEERALLDARQSGTERRGTEATVGLTLLSVLNLAMLLFGFELVRRYAVDHDRRVTAERRVVTSAKLASLGTLAAGIAHEINNPLAFVVANLEFVGRQLAGTSPKAPAGDVRDAVDEAVTGGKRIASVVRGLQLFAHGDVGASSTPVEVAPIVEDAISLVAGRTRAVATVQAELTDVPPVAAAPEGVGQVMLQLLLNASQAIPSGRPEHNHIRVRTYVRASFVCIEVQDSGCGMSRDVRSRAFDPFFTTRCAGEGMGLGLSTSRTIVTRAGGDIEVDSEEGSGSTFRVLLPIAGRSDSVTPQSGHTPSAPGADLRRLFVDQKIAQV